MTKTIITFLIAAYSLLRLATTAILYYYEAMQLPVSVVVISTVCSMLMLLIAGRCYLLQLSGKNLRLALLLAAFAAGTNMVLIMLDQPGTLTTQELIVSGTVFDILAFIGCCTIKIRDTRGHTGRSPFSRVARQENKAQSEK